MFSVIECFSTCNLFFREQLELAIAVMKKFLSVLNPRDVIKLYGVHLGRALEHPDVEAKKLVLNEVLNIKYLTFLLHEVSTFTYYVHIIFLVEKIIF